MFKEDIRRATNANEDLKLKIENIRGDIEDVVMKTEQVLTHNEALREERQALSIDCAAGQR